MRAVVEAFRRHWWSWAGWLGHCFGVPSMELLATPSLPDSSTLPGGGVNYGFLWCRTRLVNEIGQVLHLIQAWRGVAVHCTCQGVEAAVGGVPFVDMRWDGRLVALFHRELHDHLPAEQLLECRPGEPCSDRIEWVVRKPEDVDRAVWLLRLAYLSLVNEATSEKAVAVSETARD